MTRDQMSALLGEQLRAAGTYVDARTIQGWLRELAAGAPRVTETELLQALRTVRDDPTRRPREPITVGAVLAVLRATTDAADIGNPYAPSDDCLWGCAQGVVTMRDGTAENMLALYEYAVPCSCQAGEARRQIQAPFRGAMNVEERQRRGWVLTGRRRVGSWPERD